MRDACPGSRPRIQPDQIILQTSAQGANVLATGQAVGLSFYSSMSSSFPVISNIFHDAQIDSLLRVEVSSRKKPLLAWQVASALDLKDLRSWRNAIEHALFERRSSGPFFTLALRDKWLMPAYLVSVAPCSLSLMLHDSITAEDTPNSLDGAPELFSTCGSVMTLTHR